ncbi:MAG: hypothetical protein IJB34_04355 [Clostridia bacterium]|nr:hypothetical protein [Clostridia bacterium]
MERKRVRIIERIFRCYEENKKQLEKNCGLPVPSGVAYDRPSVKADNARNGTEESFIRYAARRETLYKRVFIVEETLKWFRLEGHGRERFIRDFFIGGYSWVKTEMECCVSRDTLARWRRDVLEKAETIASWIGFFDT